MKSKVAIMALGLIIVYYGSFLLFGKNALTDKITEDSHSSYNTYRWTTHVNLISNIDFSPHHLATLNKLWFSTDVNFVFKQVDDFDQVTDFNKEETYNYVLMTNTKALPLIQLKECEKIEEYAACWRFDYVWCFFTWIKVNEESLGIS